MDNKINTNNFFDGIDAIYWINLDRSTDRRKHMESLLTNPVFANIPNIRFSAIDGKKEDFKKMFNYDEMLYYWITNGEYACTMSHLETIRKVAESPYQIALIMEDDVTLDFQKYWTDEDKIANILKDAPVDWDIIQLCYGNQIYNNLPEDKFDNRKTSATAYIIKKESAQKLIDSIYKDGKYILNPIIYPVADIYIFKILNTYAYRNSILTYKSDNDSTLHDSHLYFHELSKNMIAKHIHGDKNVVIDYKFNIVKFLCIILICALIYSFRNVVDKYIGHIFCVIIFTLLTRQIIK